MRALLICILLLFSTKLYAEDKSHEQLLEELKTVAETGDPEAQYHLGMMYHVGLGAQRNYQKAYELFEASAQAGHPLSAYKVGCYYAGQGGGVLPTDHNLALKYKLLAAEAGYSFAQHDVSGILLHKQENERAVDWLNRAATQGYADSLAVLASLHADGILADKDFVKTHAYIRLAFRQARGRLTPQVVQFLGMLEESMSEADIQHANAMVNDWVPEPTKITLKATKGLQSAIDYLENR